MTKNFFFIVIGGIFSLASVAHFLRLMFECQVKINEWVLPGWVSGLVIILGIFITYWSIKLSKESCQDSNQKEEGFEISHEE